MFLETRYLTGSNCLVTYLFLFCACNLQARALRHIRYFITKETANIAFNDMAADWTTATRVCTASLLITSAVTTARAELVGAASVKLRIDDQPRSFADHFTG